MVRVSRETMEVGGRCRKGGDKVMTIFFSLIVLIRAAFIFDPPSFLNFLNVKFSVVIVDR